ncbi:exodeoxyribonuclease III [Corynebacterium sp. TAE3-ERU12]|uniref:exodeoxyribonuclease III n=1 Tax=Corynebacterium sp. TAE3-ERU12 TaxID=2849491 RepID=UPI001C4871F9|nr:exodeoxyribonuclease III [Corynebacterium sp. TAE3-ERU12]MBV7295967.1 exodeoxyribonuclease III [Corynebacterium sp. TAE3-ERU12]
MRLCTWNVNSARTRVERIIGVLQRHDIDVMAIQETKCRDDQFPFQPFIDAGYEVAHHGLNQWNGVAIISRVGLADIERGFAQQPGFSKDPAKEAVVEPRHIAAACGDIRIHSVYVPNGRAIDDPHYQYKLNFLAELRAAAASSLADDQEAREVIVGDFNIAPRDSDVWDIDFFDGKTHVTQPERDAYNALADAGFTDVTRQFTEGEWTYWDYQQLRFPKGEGMRIDFQLASPALAACATDGFIDREERKGKGASDHAPVIVDYRS